MQGFNVQIGADVSNFNSGVQKVQQQLQKLPAVTNQSTLALSNLSRVAQDAPYGFIGIANNINPLLESFQRLKASTGSTGSALKAMGAALTGPAGLGLAVGVISSLMVTFGDRLFGAGSSAERVKKIIDELTKSFNEQKKAVDSLIEVFDDYSKIDAEILKGRGASSKQVFDAEIKYEKDNIRLKTELRTKLNDELSQLQQNQAAFDNIARTSEGRSLIRTESKINQERISEYKKNLRELSGEIDKDERGIILKRLQFSNEQAEKSKRDFEKYISDTITQGKKLADALKNIAVVPTFTVFDSISEQFKKASSVITGFNNATLKIKIPVELDLTGPGQTNMLGEPLIEQWKGTGLDMAQMLGKEMTDYFKGGKIDLSIDEALMSDKKLSEIQERWVSIAQSISSIVSPAFNEFIDSITKGENAFRAFGELIKNVLKAVIAQLLQTAIVAGILSLISGGMGAKGGFSFMGAFKQLSGFKAGGGGVGGNRSYIVGERGPELFVPSTSGRIVPNHQLGSISGGAMQMVRVMVQGQVSGKDLRLIQVRQEAYEGRNV